MNDPGQKTQETMFTIPFTRRESFADRSMISKRGPEWLNTLPEKLQNIEELNDNPRNLLFQHYIQQVILKDNPLTWNFVLHLISCYCFY